MARVFVIGVGMTKFEKPGKRDDDYPAFAKEAITKALDDCNVKITEVQAGAVGYVYGDSTSGQRALYEVGMTGMPIINVNNNCSTGSTALMVAKDWIEFNQYDCVIAVGFEKMERGSLGSKFLDRTNPLDKHIELMSDLVGINEGPITAQMFGNAGIEHMKKYGTKPEHFAKIAYKNHKHSVNNPYSQFRDEYTLEQIMKSPTIYGPLTKLQCCPTSDGSGAAILASEKFVRAHGLEGQAVEIIGMEMVTDLPTTFSARNCFNLVGYDMSKTAAERLFRKTNYKPSDVQVVELHDCFSANELITYEALGLCPPGKAGEFIDRGDNTYGGKYVVNPSGGLISKGHPLGATGLAQCAELCWQLRGQAGARQVPNCKLALQHNIGLGGAVVVALYRKGFPEFNNTNSKISTRKVNGFDGFLISPYIHLIDKALNDGKDSLIEKYRGVYGLKIKKPNGQQGYLVINIKVGEGSVEVNSKIKPDVIITINDNDLIDLIVGKLNPQKAFFQGKVKIQGNMGLAMKLIELQNTVTKQLTDIRSKL